MTWFDQGGLLMWPLLLLSITALAVILDRLIVFTTLKLPNEAAQEELLALLKKKDKKEIEGKAENFSPYFLSLLKDLGKDISVKERERLAIIRIEEFNRMLDKRLGWLAVAGRVAPLLGLLGTVLGMIDTFSSMSSIQGGAIDMTFLADGIWQALITTASGLAIAIPSVIAHQAFIRYEDSIVFVLTRFSNLSFEEGKKD